MLAPKIVLEPTSCVLGPYGSRSHDPDAWALRLVFREPGLAARTVGSESDDPGIFIYIVIIIIGPSSSKGQPHTSTQIQILSVITTILTCGNTIQSPPLTAIPEPVHEDTR